MAAAAVQAWCNRCRRGAAAEVGPERLDSGTEAAALYARSTRACCTSGTHRSRTTALRGGGAELRLWHRRRRLHAVPPDRVTSSGAQG